MKFCSSQFIGVFGCVVHFFWSTSFATPQPLKIDLVVEFGGIYPQMPSVNEKNDSFYFLSVSRTRPPDALCSPPPLDVAHLARPVENPLLDRQRPQWPGAHCSAGGAFAPADLLPPSAASCSHRQVVLANTTSSRSYPITAAPVALVPNSARSHHRKLLPWFDLIFRAMFASVLYKFVRIVSICFHFDFVFPLCINLSLMMMFTL
jgi:hypothetical protein